MTKRKNWTIMRKRKHQQMIVRSKYPDNNCLTHMFEPLDAGAVDVHGDGLVPHGGDLLVVVGRRDRAPKSVLACMSIELKMFKCYVLCS